MRGNASNENTSTGTMRRYMKVFVDFFLTEKLRRKLRRKKERRERKGYGETRRNKERRKRTPREENDTEELWINQRRDEEEGGKIVYKYQCEVEDQASRRS
jgi:hypothetical protein